MLEVALKLLKEITNNSYEAYIVGGFVRDHILGIESNDIDIATSATPKELKEIFEDILLPNEDYGSVTVIKNGIRFEITTFRREISYVNNRKPIEIEYINDLYDDLLRRDFTINTICMDEDGQIIDRLNGIKDLDNKIIRTVGFADERFREDSLRILRAIRFATVLDFNLDKDIEDAIISNKHLLRNLSYFRKKEELDKIFASSNYKKGIQLLLDFKLDEELEIPKLSRILDLDKVSLIGIWSILNVTDKYPFSKNEIELINDVNRALTMDNLDFMNLYHLGLYVNSVAAEIKGIDIKDVTETYASLTIKSKKDIDIKANDIVNILHKAPGKYIRDIYNDIEREILYNRLDNNKIVISDYISNKYK